MLHLGREYTVYSTTNGSIYGTVTSHLSLAGESKTICGRNIAKMTKRYKFFSPKDDCKSCAKKASIAIGGPHAA